MSIKKEPLVIAALYLGLLIFLFATDPSKLSIGWLLLPFAWLFLCLFLTILYLTGKLPLKKPLSRSKRYSAAFLIASLPVLTLLLKSIDQLTVKDTLLFVSLYALLMFYISKLKLAKRL